MTLPITREGGWPERWFELTAEIYWGNVLGLFLIAFAPLAYLNLSWLIRSPPPRGIRNEESGKL